MIKIINDLIEMAVSCCKEALVRGQTDDAENIAIAIERLTKALHNLRAP